jgi:hypothetical protein
MHDPWVYGSSNPFSAHVAHVLLSNAAVAAAGDCGSTPSALPVPGKGSKATHCTGRPAALVRRGEAVVGLAQSSVLRPAPNGHDLAEKAISRVLARTQPVDAARPAPDRSGAEKAHPADVAS